MYIVADVGSCHMGKWNYLKEMVHVCSSCGVDCVKLQLFGKEYETGGNVCLPRDWVKPIFNYAKEVGISMSASVFDSEALEIMFSMETPFIKFAYSKREDPGVQATLNIGKKAIVSTDPMSLSKVPLPIRNHPNYAPLFRLPLPDGMVYPTMFRTNFEGLFPPFIGLSDHSLGVTEAIEAAQFGAEWFEKHITLPYEDIICPDAAFALKPKELEVFVRKLKYEAFQGGGLGVTNV